MTASSPDIDNQLKQLRDKYAASLSGKISDLENRWSRLESAWEGDDAEEFYRLIHSLCGSSGNYEAIALASVARELEQGILTIIYAERSPQRGEIDSIEKLLGDLHQEATRWASSVLRDPGDDKANTSQAQPEVLIYLLRNGDVISTEVVSSLGDAGYDVYVADSPEALTAAVKARLPEAIILPAKSGRAGASISDLATGLGPPGERPPLIAIGDAGDVGVRLELAHAGVHKFIAAPPDPATIRRALDQLLRSSADDPYRVLLIDDDNSVASYHAEILRQGGIEVLSIADPLNALNDLHTFKPDLVLMDVYMPGCSGPDLAAVIRQDDEYTFLPVVFLSSETSVDKKMTAMNLGGDDFLSKPIVPEHFLQYILAKLKRARWMSRANRALELAQKENAYRKMALDHHAIVSVTDTDGRITSVNGKFCEITGYREEELVGCNHRIINSGYHSREFFENLWQTISSGNIWHGEICNRKRNGENYWVASTIVPYLDGQGLPYQYVSIRTDITRNKLMERKLSEHVDLTEALRDAMTRFMTEKGFHDVMEVLLQKLIRITGSEYGFMGEVLHDGDDPYLKIHAISNIAWNKDTRKLYERKNREGMEFRNTSNLLGAALRTGEIVISNEVQDDSRSGGLPNGHPPLNRFMGVPVYFGKQLVGLYGIANRHENYTQELIDFLAPFGATYGVLIHSKRITEMEHEVTDYLDRARTEAEQASRAKSEFLSSMSHELRTPLNVILGFAQLMADDPDSELSQSHKENAEEILRAGDHLLGLVNEVLDLARIEAGRLSLEIGNVEVEPLIGDCISLVQPLAQKKSIYIHYDRTKCSNVLVEADVTRLNQAVLNYLSNAVKYVPENGVVQVACDRVADDRLRVLVRDNGNGIAARDHERIFQPFSRVVSEGSNTEGAGIGLVITKRLIEEMGGSVGFESEHGEGATFWLELPVANEAIATRISEDQPERSLLDAESVVSNQYRILYIEDNPANLNLVSQAIKRRPNITLLTALEPMHGLELARSEKLDAILLDINLPHMDGFEVMNRLHHDPVTKSIPIIAVSANAMPGDIANGIAAGFTDYITKPIKLDVFFETIERILSSG